MEEIRHLSEEIKEFIEHSNRIALTYKKLPDEHKNNISRGLRNSDKRKEYYRRLSILMKEQWATGKRKNITYVRGMKMSQEIINKRRETRIDNIKKGKIKMPKGELNSCFIKLDENKIMELYQKGLSVKDISKIMGVSTSPIYHRLEKNGIKRRDVLFGYKKRIRTEDGHMVKSSPELIIDNFLFSHKIHHIYEGFIADTNYKYDFYIPSANLYIEYWGLECYEKYKKRTLDKLEVYKKLGLNLLSIYPNDDVHRKLIPLLEFSKTQTELDEFISLN